MLFNVITNYICFSSDSTIIFCKILQNASKNVIFCLCEELTKYKTTLRYKSGFKHPLQQKCNFWLDAP